MPKLSAKQIKESMAFLPGWTRKGEVIRKTYEFKNFPDAIKFVNALAKKAEKANHHPDIDIRWNKVTLALTTHDEGGLTEKDLEMARRADAI